MRGTSCRATARFHDARLVGDAWVILYRFFKDDSGSATGFENLEWWGYLEFLAPLEAATKARIDGGEPFELVSPRVTLTGVFEGSRDGNPCYLVVEAAAEP
ncbi:MAG: hypothetical protein QOJ67_2999 [Acidimicrobiaceae bacterium]